jgi:hypothetical protein
MAVTAHPRTRVEVRPIEKDDRRAVGTFLEARLNERVPAAAWAHALDVPWSAERPNMGFMLVAGDEIVGVQLAFYSQRSIAGRSERFCNLGAWCVHPDYRIDGVRLLKTALAQDGYHFTDLSPSGSVVSINTRLGFQFLDSRTALVPNLPWPTTPGRESVISDPSRIRGMLSGEDLKVYLDHASAPAALHVVLRCDQEACHVIFRKDRRKGLPLFATVLYVSNPRVFEATARAFGRHLLLRHGVPATLLERGVTDYRPRLSWAVAAPRRRMFRSASLRPPQIDYLYSELVCVPW